MRKFFTLAILAIMIALPLGAAQTQGETPNQLVQNPVTTVTGVVTDAAGVPIPGATVAVQGTTNGTLTDNYGRFALNAPVGAVLEVQCLGYATKKVTASAGAMSIALEDDIEQLNEAVSIGYGSVRKSDLTGAVAIIGSDKIKDLPQGGVTDILQGKVAGVNITTTSGDGGKAIRIRGITSINKSNEPLWVVDGVIGGTVGNFYDIENIEVLKDASATAIYGTQGANGVILVTTKRPQEGTHVTFDARYSTGNFRKMPELLSPYEFAYAYCAINGPTAISPDEMAAFKSGANPGVDWIDYCFRPSFNQSYNLNISGGSQKIKYGITAWGGGGHGLIKNQSSKSYNVKANLSVEMFPWLTFRGYAYGSVSDSHSNGFGFNDFIGYSPIMEVQDETGMFLKDPYVSIHENPGSNLYGDNRDNKSGSFQGYASLTFKILPGLTFTTEGMYTDSHSRYGQFRTAKQGPGDVASGYSQSNQSFSWRNINTLNYTQDFGDHHLNLTGAFELTQSKSSYNQLSGMGLGNEDTTWWNITLFDTVGGTNGFSNSGMVSWIGRAVYSYKEKYSLTATLRADAASQFRDKYRWGYFPSVAAAWNIDKEDFIDNTRIQQLKLRASVGTIGNAGVDPYTVFSKLSAETARNNTYMGSWPETVSNPNVHWEKTLQYNVGVDLSVFDRRLNFTADLYYKKTTDLLFQKELPDYNGGGKVWTNIGNLSNRGAEFTLNAIPVSTRDFSWETTFTASYNRTRVDDLGDVKSMVPDSDRGGGGLFAGGGVFILKKGENIGTFYLNEWAGFDEEGNNIYYNIVDGKKDGSTTTQYKAENRVLVGKGIPDWIFGWQNTLRWKNWDLGMLFRFTSSYNRLDITRYQYSCLTGPYRFITGKDAWYRSWSNVADKSHALYGNLYSSRNVNTPNSTQWLEEARFLRLQSLSLGYQIPQKLTGKTRIHFSVAGENLFVLSPYMGLDPETISDASSGQGGAQYGAGAFGLDRGAFPLPRTFSFIARFEF